jgi:Zn-dependent peptidase ImmA (M78 family)
MKMPKSVKIASQVWEISEQKRKHAMDNHYGVTNSKDNSIVIDAELAESMKRTTLFHELLHAIRITHGGSLSPNKWTDYTEAEHYWIGLYEEPVVAMLRHNPELVAYLTDES